MKIELLENLIRRCVREVLDQLEEGKNVINLNYLSEAEEDENPQSSAPDNPPGSSPETPSGNKSGDEMEKEPSTEEPETALKGALVVNPRNKSNLIPIKWEGTDESSVERTLYNMAVSIAGRDAKVSLGAQRAGRESASNPNFTIYFYFGRLDPESEEIFLIADKNLQICKDESVHPSELGAPVVSVLTRYTGKKIRNWDDEPKPEQYNPDEKYGDFESRMGSLVRPKTSMAPRYGIEEPDRFIESAAPLFKKMINKILDGRR